MSTENVRWIKKYKNRKLYCLREKKYVTLEYILAAIKNGEEIRIVEKGSGVNLLEGKDVTTQVLFQALFEEERKKDKNLSEHIHFIITEYGDLTSFVEKTVSVPKDPNED